MKEYIEKYIEWKATYTKRAAINYRPWIEKFNVVVNKPLEEVQVEDVIKFHKFLEQNYQAYSIQFGMVVVQNFFKFWKLQDKKCLNPLLIRVPKTVAKSYQAINESEYKLLLRTTLKKDFKSKRNNLIIRLLWETGMRVSELCDLDISDINPDRYIAVIRTKKSERKRQIFWSKETHVRLVDYLEERKKLNDTPALLIGLHNDIKTRRLTQRTVQRIIKQAGDEASIKTKISPHSFRHGKAHYILSKGGNPKHIQAILGHSERNPASSFVYLQLNDTEMEKYAVKYLA